MAWVTEDPWHTEQSISEDTNGEFLLAVNAAHDLEIIPRVLALGIDAELMAPEETRRILQEVIAQLGNNYSAQVSED